MINKVVALCALALLPHFFSKVNANDPKALVTFYSKGKTFMLMPGSKAAFKGKIFDDHHQLALLEQNRFVTFSLDPGVHVISANWWMTTGPGGGTHITMKLLPDHHYYISTQFKEVGVGGTDMLINEVSCEDAQQAGAQVKALEVKHLHPDGKAVLVPEKSFPACPKE